MLYSFLPMLQFLHKFTSCCMCRYGMCSTLMLICCRVDENLKRSDKWMKYLSAGKGNLLRRLGTWLGGKLRKVIYQLLNVL